MVAHKCGWCTRSFRKRADPCCACDVEPSCRAAVRQPGSHTAVASEQRRMSDVGSLRSSHDVVPSNRTARHDIGPENSANAAQAAAARRVRVARAHAPRRAHIEAAPLNLYKKGEDTRRHTDECASTKSHDRQTDRQTRPKCCSMAAPQFGSARNFPTQRLQFLEMVSSP